MNKLSLNRSEKGITLIALVITIIILLILASVSISLIIKDDGLIEQTIKSKTAHEKSSEEEDKYIKEMEETIGIYTRGDTAKKWTGEIASTFAGGDGSEDKPFEISNGEELAYLAKLVNDGDGQQGLYFELTTDIDLQNKEWTPVGGIVKASEIYTTDVINEFDGIFNGNNKIIFGLSIDKTTEGFIGFIGGTTENALVKDVIIGSGDIKGAAFVGGIVGENRGTISGCTNYASVTSYDDPNITGTGEITGGIAGVTSGTIKDCINRGTILGVNNSLKTGRGKCVGGITGTSANGANNEAIEIYNCTNYGNITSQYQQASGIIGSHQDSKILKIDNCINYGDISASPLGEQLKSSCSAGIISCCYGPCEISNSKNMGKVYANGNTAGGIIGDCIASATANIIPKITNCSNYGDIIVEKGQNAGGIIASLSDYGIVTNCINEGNVSAGRSTSWWDYRWYIRL